MTDTQETGVAIVGCGIIGQQHARVLSGTPGVRIRAVVDAVSAAATAVADQVEETGAERPAEHADLADALSSGSVDLVVICTPSGLHVRLAEVAVAAGCHVVIEKPLDVRMDRGRRLAELAAEAEARGRVVSVISQHRFDPASVAVAAAAHSGRLGRITSGVASVAWWRSQEYYDSGQWRGTWELDGGGALMNQGVHTVDLLLWFLGTPVEVHAHTGLLAHERIEVEDVAVATVTFESGALAVLHATTAAYPGLSVRVSVFGSEGSGVIDDDRLTYLTGAEAESSGDAGAGSEAIPEDFGSGHQRQYADILDAIRTGRPPGVRVADALLALATVRAVYLSQALGRSVRVADVLDGTLDDAVIGRDSIVGGAR